MVVFCRCRKSTWPLFLFISFQQYPSIFPSLKRIYFSSTAVYSLITVQKSLKFLFCCCLFLTLAGFPLLDICVLNTLWVIIKNKSTLIYVYRPPTCCRVRFVVYRIGNYIFIAFLLNPRNHHNNHLHKCPADRKREGVLNWIKVGTKVTARIIFLCLANVMMAIR